MSYLSKALASSDFGTHPGRIDIVTRGSNYTGNLLKTVPEIIAAIKAGKKVIRADIDVGKDVYKNELVKAIKKLGIDDIRYGTMHSTLGGEGYTLYRDDVDEDDMIDEDE